MSPALASLAVTPWCAKAGEVAEKTIVQKKSRVSAANFFMIQNPSLFANTSYKFRSTADLNSLPVDNNRIVLKTELRQINSCNFRFLLDQVREYQGSAEFVGFAVIFGEQVPVCGFRNPETPLRTGAGGSSDKKE